MVTGRSCLLAIATFSLSHLVSAVPYYLTQSYDGATFFNNFDFITSDPTNGFVQYVDQGTAQSLGYARADSTGAYLGVDSTSVLDPNGVGRRSVRIESKSSFTTGLFIGDFSHMPAGCGLWPAFWMYGPNWPNSGEIDIIEGVNNQLTNQISGHTNPGCVISGGVARAQLYQNTCYQPDNSGCFFKARAVHSYGDAFNSVGGGVYAMQWTTNWISVWFFKRSQIPNDIKSNQPNPATWGRPMAMFSGSGCNVGQHFNQMKIVLNTDFCGPWASAVWGGCPGSSCQEYVAGNPGAFANAFWHVNSIKVFNPAFTGSEAFYWNATTPSAPETSVIPLASSLPEYTAPPDAMGATQSAVIGPEPTITTFLPVHT